ncbi:UNVERIFIED_CONTAM: hypothetical protein HDU68_006214, partial [Siphonaria sp. JEL0065]
MGPKKEKAGNPVKQRAPRIKKENPQRKSKTVTAAAVAQANVIEQSLVQPENHQINQQSFELDDDADTVGSDEDVAGSQPTLQVPAKRKLDGESPVLEPKAENDLVVVQPDVPKFITTSVPDT